MSLLESSDIELSDLEEFDGNTSNIAEPRSQMIDVEPEQVSGDVAGSADQEHADQEHENNEEVILILFTYLFHSFNLFLNKAVDIQSNLDLRELDI